MDIEDLPGTCTFLHFQLTVCFGSLRSAKVEPWQEEEVGSFEPQMLGSNVARVCAVLANSRRVFYKYDPSKQNPFTEYATHHPQGTPAFVNDNNDDQPCCFYNGRFVRVNRDNGR